MQNQLQGALPHERNLPGAASLSSNGRCSEAIDSATPTPLHSRAPRRLHRPPSPRRMPPRTLASLAHALGAASDLDVALVALGEALAEVDRSARVVLLSFDARRQLFRATLTPRD